MTAPEPTPGQASHGPRTCGECQAMIRRGRHRIIDLLGHGGYLASGDRRPWREVRQAWAEAANAIISEWDGHWGPLDSFDTWMGARGREEGDGHAYSWDDMLAAFAAGAQVTAAAPAEEDAPGQVPPVFRDRFTVIPDSGVTELNCSRCDGFPRGFLVWSGYHPSLDVLIEQGRAHDAARHSHEGPQPPDSASR